MEDLLQKAGAGALESFSNPDFGTIRGMEIDGEPWFVGRDVAAALGYKDPGKAVRDHVSIEDRLMGSQNAPPSITDNLGRDQWPTWINESGLYSLILGSKLEGAREFKRWVTSEVIPSIRRRGAYFTPAVLDSIFQDPDNILRIATAYKQEHDARIQAEAARKALEAQAQADRPRVIFAEAVEASTSSILIGELAKLLKQNGVEMGEKRLFSWLRSHGYLISRHGTDWNAPTQRSMELGLFQVKETAITHSDGRVTVSKTTKVTGKGQQYFINLFLADFKPKEPVKREQAEEAVGNA